MSAVCPNGHDSESADYCDTCGAPIPPQGAVGSLEAAPDGSPGAGEASAAGAAGSRGTGAASAAGAASISNEPQPPSAETQAAHACPNCGMVASSDALFCEACGYDFTTGAMPRSVASPAGPGAGESEASPVPPQIALEWVAELWVDPEWFAEQEAEGPCPSAGLPLIVPLRVQSALIGRVSASRNIHPEIDCSTDSGVSRRHAQLTTDGSRWFVEDLQSSNGTFVGPASGPIPDKPIDAGPKTELNDDDRLYVGAWTRIVVRRATEDERHATG